VVEVRIERVVVFELFSEVGKGLKRRRTRVILLRNHRWRWGTPDRVLVFCDSKGQHIFESNELLV